MATANERIVLILAGMVLGARVSAAQNPPEASGVRYGRLVIQGGILVDGLGNPARGPVDIVIEGDTISEIIPVDPVALGSAGSRLERATGDRVIDAAGMYLLPGFIEMHGHTPEGRVVPSGEWGRSYAYQLWLAHGVTTVRDLGAGAGLEVLVEDARKSEANEIAAPRMIPYAGWPGLGRSDQKNVTPDEVRARVQDLARRGAKGIKVFGPTYTDTLTALCDEARKVGIGVAIHVGIGQAGRGGRVEGRSHIHRALVRNSRRRDPGVQRLPADYNVMDELDRFRYAGKLWRDVDPELLEQVMDLFIENGTVLDPTFVAYEPNRDLVRAQNLPWYGKYALPVMLEYWKPNPSHHGSYHYEWTTDDEVSWRENFRLWMNFVHEFARRGGRLTLASDPGGSYGLFGFTYVREMELYREMGLDPINIIEAASTTAAGVLGLSRLAGGIRLGAMADVLVVNGNPLRDLKVLYGTGTTKRGTDGNVEPTGGIRYTIKAGVVFDAPALLRNVEVMVRQASGQSGKGTTSQSRPQVR